MTSDALRRVRRVVVDRSFRATQKPEDFTPDERRLIVRGLLARMRLREAREWRRP